MTLPYSRSTSGRAAADEIRKTLLTFGCSKFAPMEDFTAGKVIIQFEYHRRLVQIEASANGYAAAWLRENPYNSRMKKTEDEHKQVALERGQIAVWSVLRDWIKGQLTAVDTGILTFDGAFLGQILLPSGETILQRATAQNLLPPPETKR